MNKKFLQLFALLLLTVTGFSQTSALFFSEYSEGSSNNKYLEIFNGTGSDEDLSDYAILTNYNGNAWSGLMTFASNTTLKDNDVYVIANSSSDTFITNRADITMAYNDSGYVVGFNGDDVRALCRIIKTPGTTETDTFTYYGTDIYLQRIDIIGAYDMNDPGSGWDVAGTAAATKDHTLVRKSSIADPNTDWSASAGTTTTNSEWEVLAKNTWTGIGMHTFTPPVNYYSIASVTSNDADGKPDSIDVVCWVKGVVVGIDMDGNTGVSFTINDGDGINVYNYKDVSNYVVTEGDEIAAHGKIGFYNGLTEIIVDSIYKMSAGNAIPTVKTVTALDESTESELVKIENVTLIDATQWPGSGSANVDITNGTDTFTMRIDGDTDIPGTAAPAGLFDIIGIGGQYDYKSPYFEGYQLFPRTKADIIDKSIKYETITNATTNDVGGMPVMIGQVVWLKGLVYGVDLDGNSGYSFTLNDGTDGINVYHYKDINSYVVTEGDEISVHGEIAFYKGLTEIKPDSIILHTQGNTIPAAKAVTVLDESTESELVTLEKVKLVDASKWPAAGSSANVDVANATDTFTLRIDSDTDVDGMAAPMGFFNVTGIGGQYDYDSAYFEGYQLFPRYMSDIVLLGQEKLVVNEVVADNASTLADENGDFDDWIEIFNPNSSDVDLSGWYLSDADQVMWMFPDTSIKANGYLIVWADKDNKGLHTDFALSKDNGDAVYIYNPAKAVVDSVIFGAQKVDTSFARVPNGTGNFRFAMPTPGKANEVFPKPIPAYNIGDIHGVNANGEADSTDVKCKLTGIVTTQNFGGTSFLSFYMQDATGGINVYNGAGTDLYDVMEGDKIEVTGTVLQYNGIIEIKAEAIMVMDSNQTLPDPVEITTLDETHESELVVVKALSIVDTTLNLSSGMNIRVTNGTDTFEMRLDDMSELFQNDVIDTVFDLVGVLGQYDRDAPYLEGYQVMPRYVSDVTLHTNSIKENNFDQLFKVYPNPNDGNFSLLNNTQSSLNVRIIDARGQEVYTTRTSDRVHQISLNAQSGIYFIMITNEATREHSTGRIILK